MGPAAIALIAGPVACLDSQERGAEDEDDPGRDDGDSPGGGGAVDTPFDFDDCVEGAWPGQPASCDQPPDLPVPVATTPDGLAALHWAVDLGCIRLTYDPGLEAARERLAEAVAAWDDQTCGRLCFGNLKPAEAPPGTLCHAHAIHFTADPGEFAGEEIVGTSVVYDEHTGILRSALVAMSDPDVGGKNLVSAVGRALGLSSAIPDAVVPTDDDEASLCFLYGRAPYCDG